MRVKIGNYKLFFNISRYITVQGVNSKNPEGKHFLMWDFDAKPLDQIASILTTIQKEWDLPNIYILSTGATDHYHAYSFCQVTWGTALHILTDTPMIDPMFVKIACVRGYFTLRFSDKKNRQFQIVKFLASDTPEECDPFTHKNFITYETKRK